MQTYIYVLEKRKGAQRKMLLLRALTDLIEFSDILKYELCLSCFSYMTSGEIKTGTNETTVDITRV